ncbi:MAG: hypothetical protein QOF62_2349 [Pyrinomonadaceae bacterium]|jgi:hypothetical protein|nr:hypothetical protein [Pyrinomonadaceae bacterium]
MSLRPKISQGVADELMYRNRHTCCVCHTPRKHTQIHHIDGDSSNNTFANLAVLSLDCHSLVTGDEGLGRSYTAGEVARYKTHWEQQCAVLNIENESSESEDEEEDDEVDEESDQPAEHHYEDSILEADSHLHLPYSLSDGDNIALWIDSDEPLTVMFIDTEDYGLWDSGKEVDPHELHEDVYALNTTFVAEEDGNYSIVVCNFGNENANLQLDLAVWE